MFAYVGCRTTRERNARGDGLRVFRIDSATAAWTPVQLVKGLDNPSFLAFDRQQRFLYAVHGDLRVGPRSIPALTKPSQHQPN